MIAIDLSKQEALHAAPKAIQQVNFTGNLKKQSNIKNFTINFTIFLIVLLGTLGANLSGNLLNGKSHHLTNFEIQKYYQNKPKFNGVYSRNNLPKTKDGAYLINLDEYKSIGTHWIALKM